MTVDGTHLRVLTRGVGGRRARCRWRARSPRSTSSSSGILLILALVERRRRGAGGGARRAGGAHGARPDRAASRAAPRRWPPTPTSRSAWRSATATTSSSRLAPQLQRHARRARALGGGAAPARGRREPRAAHADRQPAREHPDARGRRPAARRRARRAARRHRRGARRADRAGGGRGGAGARHQAGRGARRRAARRGRGRGGGARARPRGRAAWRSDAELEPTVVRRRARPHRARGVEPARQRGQVEPAGRLDRGRRCATACSRCATTARASPTTTCRTCSSASTAPTARAACRARGWAWRS